MTRQVRTALGALVGATLVLLLHPKSRPYLLSPCLLPPASHRIEAMSTLPEERGKLPNPASLAEASLWLQTGAASDLAGKKLEVDAALTLVEVAGRGEQAEPDNAFWPQMKSLFISRALGGGPRADQSSIETWIKASDLAVWNDHQTARLVALADSIETKSGSEFSWQKAVAYSKRSSAVAQRLLRHSRTLASRNPDNNDIKVANVKNGILIRDGARSVSAALEGATMVNMVGIRRPSTDAAVSSARVTVESFGDFVKNVPLEDQAVRNQIVDGFTSNAAWFAFVPVQDSFRLAIDSIRLSVYVAILPSSLLLAAIIGAVAVALGAAFSRSRWLQAAVSAPWCFALGLGLSTLIALTTGLQMGAFWVLLSVSTFSLGNERSLSTVPKDLGTVLKGTMTALACSTFAFLTMHLVQASAVGKVLAQEHDFAILWPETSQVSLQFVFFGLSIVVATAPAWGYFYRYKPRSVLPLSLRTFGVQMGVGALALTVLLTPVCMFLDRALDKNLSEILENEPNHYLLQESGPH